MSEHSHPEHSHHEHEESEELEPKTRIVFIVISLTLFAAAMIVTRTVSLPLWARALIFALPYLAAGWSVLKEAAECFLHREFFEESTLMAIATLGAFAIGEYPEGVAVMVLFQIGELLEDLASDRSRRSIEKLMEIRPDEANVIMPDGTVKAVGAEEVEPGAVILIKPGERVPLDGIVTEGTTSLDVSALTGESVPLDAGEGDGIISGAVNLNGTVKARVIRPASESTAARILELVEEAEDRKANFQGFTERFAHVYTPIVVGLAVILAVVPPLAGLGSWKEWIYRALEFLVVSCPCAFVISVPMTFVSGIGAASSKGILIKGAAFAERLADVRTVVFDKTGTVTSGRFRVSETKPAEGVSEYELIRMCAAAEIYSDHPIAVSLKERFVSMSSPEALKALASSVGMSENLPGRGVVTRYGDSVVICGSEALMRDFGADAGGMSGGASTAVYCALKTDENVRFLGRVSISDTLKAGAREAVAELSAAGVKRIVMLTGDREEAAKQAATECGIAEYRSGLLPQDKVDELEKLMYADEKSKTAFIGDGVNDAPVIARADVGIAMGALGSDAAIEAADVVLMDDDPRKAAEAVKIAGKTMSVVRQNVAAAIVLKAAILILCGAGIAPMWAAVFGDVGVTMLCCLNALIAGRA